MSISQNYPTISPSLSLDFANVKKLDPRITYARASEARYYDGKTVAKAEENLFLYSQEFENSSWGKYLLSVVANTTTAPDGTSTADEVIIPATSGTHQLYTSVTFIATQYTFSVYAKYSEVQFLQLIGQPAYFCNFDILNGVIGTPSGGTASIQNAGDGWYRCSITFTATAMSYTPVFTPVPLLTSALTADYTGNGTLGYYIWGAQLEQRSAVSSYTPTTTQPITNYQPTLLTSSANVARFDHDPVTNESLGLLVEEQRTNLVTYSEDFGNASWTKTSVTITPNTVIAPDGTLTGDTILFALDNGGSQLYKSVSSISGSATDSVYLRADVPVSMSFGFYDSPNADTVTINVTNVWQRFTHTRASGLTGTDSRAVWLFTNAGAGSNVNVYAWGAQLEVGAFPTSYIPTVASQVTRSADSASMTGANFSSWYRADEGTVYVEASLLSVASTFPQNIWSIYASTTSHIRLWLWEGTPSVNRFLVSNGTTQSEIVSTALIANVDFKNTSTYRVNDFSASTNSSSIGTDNFGTIPTGLSSLYIGNYTGVSHYMSGHIKKLSYFPARLSNEELQEMTS